jgi:hypothetical protein
VAKVAKAHKEEINGMKVAEVEDLGVEVCTKMLHAACSIFTA